MPAQPPLRSWVSAGAYGIPVYDHSTLSAPGTTQDEVRLVQPMIMAQGATWGGHLHFSGTLNLEGLTIPDGQITPGAWGESYIDRRHPHTYVHELMVWGEARPGDGPLRLSLAAGKGFVPFGTDDPMNRPFVRYPVNHHLAQVIERAMTAAGARLGPVALEAALFNGDEPTGPGSWPNLSRFGDSWAARLTVFPAAGLELQGSHALVTSPEHRDGSGLDQSKWSVSARWEGEIARHPAYAFAEWERSSEAQGFYLYHSILSELAWRPGRLRLSYRFERTSRPEEERAGSRWRTPRPLLDNAVQGVTRWTINTAGLSYELAPATSQLQAAPFLELSYGAITPLSGAFDPAAFYGQPHFWMLSVGARLGWGMRHRMGRYGVVAPPTSDHMAMAGMPANAARP